MGFPIKLLGKKAFAPFPGGLIFLCAKAVKRGEDERWLAAFFHFACFEKKRLIFSCVCDKMGKSSGTKRLRKIHAA